MTPLANHVWQSTLFAAAVWLLTNMLRRNRASVRCSLWIAASAKFLIPFSLIVSAGNLVEWRVKPAAVWTAPLSEIGAPFPTRPSGPRGRSKPANPAGAALWVVWLGGAAAGAVSWARQWRQAHAALANGSTLPLGLPIRAVSIRERWAPGVFGVFRPTLLLPADIAERLTPEELDAVVAHELCHARRHDNLWAAVPTAVETIFWFYPPAHWIGAQILAERERACDEEVALTNAPRTYADGILRVCSWYVAAPPACMAGAQGAKLKDRVVAIVMDAPALPLGGWKRALVGGAAALAVAGPFAVGVWNAPAGRAQTAAGARPRFEVASVKPFKAGPENRVSRADHGSVTFRQQPLRAIIRFAYGLRPADVIEGPGWIDTAEFDIQAKGPEDAPREQLQLMMQQLLEERFGLILHRKTQDRDVYTLTPGGKAGRGMKRVDSPPKRGFFVKVEGSFLHYELMADMPDFANLLRMFLELPVLDQTGMSGVYEFSLRVELNEDAKLPQPGQRFDGFGLTPGVFAGVEELGLKLVKTKAPLEVLTIDHVERPTEN